MAELQEKIYGWKSALDSQGIKMNLMKTKVMVSKIGQITVKLSSKKDPCGIRGRKTMLNAVLCKSCGNRIHERCAKIERVTFQCLEEKIKILLSQVKPSTQLNRRPEV